jgi:hypothetical protein
MMVRSLKKERTITIRSLLLQVIISIVDVDHLYRPSEYLRPDGWSWVLIAAGLVAGGLQSRTTALTVRGDRVLGKRSGWFLIVWGLAFTITQLLAVFARGGMASYGLLTIYFATGLSIGANLGLFMRRQQVLSHSGAPTAMTCPGCGTEMQPGTRFCTGCGRELAPASTEQTACLPAAQQPSPDSGSVQAAAIPLIELNA